MPYRKLSRSTPQRRVVLEELQNVVSHPTAVELYEIVRRRLPKISLGTVYRNLDRLAEEGTIQKLELGGTEVRFDGNPDCHYHVRCVRCGRVDDVPGRPADLVRADLKEVAGFEILGHRLEFIGLCPDCQSKRDVI
jgi:Fur family ferric uptake transcriptional regulator